MKQTNQNFRENKVKKGGESQNQLWFSRDFIKDIHFKKEVA